MKTYWAILMSMGVCAAVSATQIGNPEKYTFRASDNGSDVKAFIPSVEKGQILTCNFTDQSDADNYMFVDFGSFPLADYLPGGYLEVDSEIDNPILRMSLCVADPARFWPTRVVLNGEMPLKAGRSKVRFYLDELPDKAKENSNYHLFLFLHDMGGKSRGKAMLRVFNTRFVKSAPGWEKEKSDAYRAQYNWRKFPELGKYYRGKYDRLLPAAAVTGNPFIETISLNGEFDKSYAGDLTWNYGQLLNDTPARPGSPLAGAKKVRVPEQETPDQPGGHYWYKRDFDLRKPAAGRVYLQIKDLADTAELYINGERVGTITCARRRNDWILTNSSRQTQLWGKPAREMMKFQHFERCGIAFPFDEKAIPDEDVLLLPILTGKYPWNYVYDITDLVKAGRNTLAVRLYNNPVRGYWIFRNGEARHHKGVAGIFGDVNLYVEPASAFLALNPVAAGKVAEDGTVVRTISGKVRPGTAAVSADGHGLRGDAVPDSEGNFSIPLTLPANFDRYRFSVNAKDKEGRVFDAQNVEFNGSVIEFRNDKLFVNGDPFLIRGVNGDLGIEWENDRTQTRRRWLNRLTFFKNLGFNALRLEGCTAEQIDDALQAGIMVVPVYASGSCNTTEVALGNLDKPDFQFITDPHEEMARQLNHCPNILFWNSGNENHPTAGYNDKVLMDRYLAVARERLRGADPDRRPVTYANLDTFGNFWFFTAGQDVLGYNSYQFIPEFKTLAANIYQRTKMPIVFCEWGFTENQTKGTRYRNENVEKWEREMREKLSLMRQCPGVVGGFLFPHHGELEDVRGREFLQEIMAPFKLTCENDSIKFENQDVAPLRKVSLLLVSPDNVISSEWADELKPGRSLRVAFPTDAKKNDALRLEIRFETHRGLNHSYTKMVNRIPGNR